MQIEASDQTLVAVRNGALRGLDLGDVVVFNGVPYAKPPIGDLRWAPPQPAENWEGVREAKDVSPQAPQNQDLGVFARPGGQEDCLYLNVWMPKSARSASAKLPVMVWIHGGALSVGAASDHDGSRLAVEGNTVVVTINYRLGVLGMFAHPAIKAEGDPWGNYWLMDQQEALRWVRDNIEAFGGDPSNVIIIGESSGGASVFTHMISPASAGLFHHAVNMSGSAVMLRHPHFAAPKPPELALETGLAFAKAVGCEGEGPEAAACLRSLSVEQVLKTQTPYLLNQAIIDGVLVPKHHADMIKTGKVNGQTLTAGVTRHEWHWAVAFAENASGVPMGPEAYVKAMEDYYGEEIAAKVMAEYPISKYPSPSEAFAAAVTSSLFTCTNHKAMALLSERMPVYAYEFVDTTAPSYLETASFPIGAGHTFELAYLFPGYRGGAGRPISLNAMQERLAQKMVQLFSKTHLADGERAAEWPRYDPVKENYLALVLPEPRVMSQKFGEVHKADFWDSVGLY